MCALTMSRWPGMKCLDFNECGWQWLLGIERNPEVPDPIQDTSSQIADSAPRILDPRMVLSETLN